MRKTLLSMSLLLALGGISAVHATDRALKLSKEWQRMPSSASLADAGKVVFPFGETLHTITCAPLRQCDIQLQPGEKVNNVKIGDKVRTIAELHEVPLGTEGRILLANGFSWLRYRVLFDNGAELGDLDHRTIEPIGRAAKRVAKRAKVAARGA